MAFKPSMAMVMAARPSSARACWSSSAGRMVVTSGRVRALDRVRSSSRSNALALSRAEVR